MASYSVRIHAIVTGKTQADTTTPTPAEIVIKIKDLNQIYASANVQFEFDPATDVETSTRPNLMDDHPMTANGALVPPVAPNVDKSTTTKIQNTYADQYLGKLVIYFRDWNDKWKNNAGEPISVFNFSDINHRMIRVLKDCEGYRLAHEAGHYFALAHPFSDAAPNTVSEAADLIANHIMTTNLPPDRGLEVFDFDLGEVNDTPPDPGPALFQNVFGDPCAGNGVIELSVTLLPTFVKKYFLAPDRANVMSYFMDCAAANCHLSPDQGKVVRQTLEGPQRNHLIVPRVLYDAVWRQGNTGQTSVFGWALKDFAAHFNQEIKTKRHCVLMHATSLEDGQIRYNAAWEPGDRGQTRAISWAFADFPQRMTDELGNKKHLVHMQAYDLGGGQIRYDGVWEKTSHGQTFAISWALEDLEERFNQELKENRRCIHLQGYDIGGGQPRYDAVWEPGVQGQSFVLGWAFDDFAVRFQEELNKHRSCVHMQAFDIGGGQIRYNAIWQSGDRGQTHAIGWAFNDFARRFDEELAKKNRHLVLMQGYDIGGGQIRYDGVWAKDNFLQTRMMGATFNEAAKRRKVEIDKGRHLVHFQSYKRSGKFG